MRGSLWKHFPGPLTSGTERSCMNYQPSYPDFPGKSPCKKIRWEHSSMVEAWTVPQTRPPVLETVICTDELSTWKAETEGLGQPGLQSKGDPIQKKKKKSFCQHSWDRDTGPVPCSSLRRSFHLWGNLTRVRSRSSTSTENFKMNR